MCKHRSLAMAVVATLFSVGFLTACKQGAAEKTSLNSFDEKVGYAIGMDIGRSLSRVPTSLDLDSVAQGMRDSLTEGKEKLLSPEEAQTIMKEFSQQMQQAQSSQTEEQLKKNGEEGTAFLAKNKEDAEVKVTESGLQYKVVREGTGKKPTAENKVTVHYEGKLVDGTVFDSSYERGSPVTFPVSGVIPGWTEGLQLMSVGSEYMMYIPAELAYGERGAGGRIGPNQTLIFKVELLSIEE